jgi:hypothetical protein
VTFDLSALRGPLTANKGMALFPRRIDGRYAMLGRHDHENIWLLLSSDLYTWERGTKIISPKWIWEFVQVGNCGSPIEIDEGWLVITVLSVGCELVSPRCSPLFETHAYPESDFHSARAAERRSLKVCRSTMWRSRLK